MTLVGQSFDRNGDFYRREEDGSSFAPDPLGGPGLVSTLSLLHKLFFFFFYSCSAFIFTVIDYLIVYIVYNLSMLLLIVFGLCLIFC